MVVEALSCSSCCPAASWLAPSCLKTRGSPVRLINQYEQLMETWKRSKPLITSEVCILWMTHRNSIKHYCTQFSLSLTLHFFHEIAEVWKLQLYCTHALSACVYISTGCECALSSELLLITRCAYIRIPNMYGHG